MHRRTVAHGSAGVSKVGHMLSPGFEVEALKSLNFAIQNASEAASVLVLLRIELLNYTAYLFSFFFLLFVQYLNSSNFIHARMHQVPLLGRISADNNALLAIFFNPCIVTAGCISFPPVMTCSSCLYQNGCNVPLSFVPSSIRNSEKCSAA